MFTTGAVDGACVGAIEGNTAGSFEGATDGVAPAPDDLPNPLGRFDVLELPLLLLLLLPLELPLLLDPLLEPPDFVADGDGDGDAAFFTVSACCFETSVTPSPAAYAVTVTLPLLSCDGILTAMAMCRVLDRVVL
ncbi:hypothetical protein [Actinoallomurus iriomotensis]|uniref:Uncharacterized protein n=1 Tax=Actinoallomurus iriomotensis TaxID=478107 RepID=A0A9W6RPF1_9ACTN|nr:hypothetical protein [Actinoallomurus iriomotensis]GLY79378.1 hypothetical protein Airi01_076450 [Actinoallomurus iriomotensis]